MSPESPSPQPENVSRSEYARIKAVYPKWTHKEIMDEIARRDERDKNIRKNLKRKGGSHVTGGMKRTTKGNT